jgi:glycerophosphoryl diester phosphodiesterase
MLFFTLILHLLLIFIVKICQGVERPLVIGHRGSAYLPELTLETQSIAHAFGADMVEIDICLSKDNQLIVIHGNIFQSSIINSLSSSK